MARQMEKRLGALQHGELCMVEFDGRKRVLMRVLPVDMATASFDSNALVYVQLSGSNHTEGHGVVYTGLDPEMPVEVLSVTVSVPVFR